MGVSGYRQFGGLIETIDESIKFPSISKEMAGDEFILAGPTCDSMDILYENFNTTCGYTVPGDRVYIFTTGAYTRSYSSICFMASPL
jgi:ornithine decarboxylase